MGSHYDQNAGWLKHIFGSPDNPEKHDAEYKRSGLRTEAYFRQFKQLTGQ
jgi:hypothetical protein